MLREERHQAILERLQLHGKVIATELSQILSVSEDTVRRDLREMDSLGLLHRVHGGALPKSPSAAHFEDRQRDSVESKEKLAEAAISLVRNGQVILMDGSTSTLRVAERLPHHLMATVITNSPPIAVALAAHPKIDVVMLGGQLHKNSLVNIGAATVEALSKIRADLCFLGVCSIHPEIGISVPYLEETYVKKQMIEASSEIVALATADKLGTASSFIVAPTHALTYLITDHEVPDETLQPYRQLGISILRG
ncbi:DeoR/GlpR family DNA-binding transcription regulator [Paenibacillus filicis]|uniref:Lactose phosphotransferase system repressor n=1 Tax=Paenibacillus filicis TaxID=669464 RepID=A0ABU9DJK5_9BACL